MASNYKGYVIFANTLYYDDLLINIMNLSMLNKEYSSLNTEEERKEAQINDVITMLKNYYCKLNNKSYDELINALSIKENYIELINDLDDSKMKEYLLSKLK